MKKGFTLIELLVVMAILGLLATIGLGSFQSSQMKGRDAQRKHDLGQMQKALEMFYNDSRRYPTNAEGLPAAPAKWEDAAGTVYIKSVPGDPKGGLYCYESNDSGAWYRLYAKLENSQDPAIGKSGCGGGCECDSEAFNYRVWSSNAP